MKKKEFEARVKKMRVMEELEKTDVMVRLKTIKEFGGIIVIVGVTAIILQTLGGDFLRIGAFIGLGILLHQYAKGKLYEMRENLRHRVE
jgi:hypothetical protein